MKPKMSMFAVCHRLLATLFVTFSTLHHSLKTPFNLRHMDGQNTGEIFYEFLNRFQTNSHFKFSLQYLDSA